MAYFEQFKQLDAQTLFSGSVSAPTVGAAIDTSNFGNIIVQYSSTSGVGQIQAYIEGTNDQVEWFSILLNPINDLSVVDTITAEGGYQFKTSFKYIRTNTTYVLGTYNINILGRAGPGENASDALTAAFNPDTPLQVAFGAGVKQDKSGALILSDGIPYLLAGSNTFIINLDGYSTIILQMATAQTVTATQSIDGTFWTPSYFGLHSAAQVSVTPSVAGLWTAPVLGKYLRLIVSGALAGPTLVSVMLKQGSMTFGHYNGGTTSVNLAQFSGTGIAGTGTAGQLGVGGIQVAGGAASAFPVAVAGADAGNLIRNLRTDTLGRTIANSNLSQVGSVYISGVTTANTNYPLSANNVYPQNLIGILPSTFQQSAALNVQDTTQFEGQSVAELLAQILLEMRIMNQQLYELPRSLATNQNASDPPEQFRSEPSIFNQ